VTAARSTQVLLGSVRLVNGLATLAAPARFAGRLAGGPQDDPALLYVLRMFGVRTAIMGGELLFGDEHTRARAARIAPIVHASDTVAAALLAKSGKLPRRAGLLLTAISAVNTLLSLAARRG
jgi:hypothetical protein